MCFLQVCCPFPQYAIDWSYTALKPLFCRFHYCFTNIKICWQNLVFFFPGSENHFDLVEQSAGDFILPGYDYESLLHYGRLAFSANGQPTLQARDDPIRMLGQTDGLSRKDIEKVNKLYKCQGNVCL